MDLERISVTLRPRGAWEAIDLGFAMFRRWYRPVLASWIAVVWPVALVLNVAFREFLWLPPLLLWWLKPLFDRIPLAVVSRGFFGELPGPRQILTKLPHYLGRGVFAALTWRRLLPWRSYVLPVAQLERLTGAARKRRIHVFTQAGAGMGTLLTAICIFFEAIVFSFPFALAMILVPDGDLTSPLAGYVANASYVVAMTGVEPLYVAAGFSLYINRRVHLEGWDIELGLRRMARRLLRLVQPGASAAAVVLVFLVATAALGHAAPALGREPGGPPAAGPIEHPDVAQAIAGQEVAQAIADVLADPAFQTRQPRGAWRLRRNPSDGPEPPDPRGAMPLLAHLLATVLAWGLVAIALFLVAYVGVATLGRHRRRGLAATASPASRSEERAVAALIDPASLPDDIVGAARAAWVRGDPAAALGLLYRGALARLVSRLSIRVPASATEGECVALIRGRMPDSLTADVESLIRAWQQAAYAQRPPAAAGFHNLCQAWTTHFGSAG